MSAFAKVKCAPMYSSANKTNTCTNLDLLLKAIPIKCWCKIQTGHLHKPFQETGHVISQWCECTLHNDFRMKIFSTASCFHSSLAWHRGQAGTFLIISFSIAALSCRVSGANGTAYRGLHAVVLYVYWSLTLDLTTATYKVPAATYKVQNHRPAHTLFDSDYMGVTALLATLALLLNIHIN